MKGKAVQLRREVDFFEWNGNLSELVEWFDEIHKELVPISNFFAEFEDKLVYHGKDEDSVIVIKVGEYIVKDAEYYSILKEEEFNRMFYQLEEVI